MKPKELYNLQSESETNDLNLLKGMYYNHIKELDLDTYYFHDNVLELNTKITIKILKDFSFDHRRYWRLATVWFNNKPIMIIQNAGREGDDHSKRFITDEKMYLEMVTFIKSLLDREIPEVEDLIDQNTNLIDIDTFYGYSLDSEFEEHKY